MAEVLFDAAEKRFRARGMAEVGLKRGGGPADCLGRLVRCSAVSMDSNRGSGLGECCSDGGAEAAGCTGDEGYFAVEAEEIKDRTGHEVEFTG